MAMRSNQMKSIVMLPVREGEIKNWDAFTETYERGEKLSDNVVGYFARFETVNGFVKATYWTKDEVLKHAKRFSKSFNSSSSPWTSDFDSMACKTVLLSSMKTYAPMSIDMQMGIERDEKVVKTDEATGQEEYVDAEILEEAVGGDAIDVAADGRKVDTETGELFPG